jgi:ElaB/YqjD/DUF883 family membrane-anchored ribosome-binding protein
MDHENTVPGGPGVPDDGDGTRAGSYDRTFVDEDTPRASVQRAAQGRLDAAADAGRNRVAEKLEQISDRLEERAFEMEESGGVQRHAGHVVLRAGDALDRSADYLRSHDHHDMRDDLEHSIRTRPLLSVGLAAGAGFLLARLLRE